MATGNGSDGTQSQNPKEPTLNVLSASWSLSGVSFRITNTDEETVTLTAIYLKTEWGDALLYAQPLPIKPAIACLT